MSNGEGPHCYMVRANKQRDKDFELLFSEGIVGIGYSSTDFTAYDIDELRSLIEKKYFDDDAAPQYVGRKLNEVERFKSIEAGDRILVPYHGTVALAIAEGELQHDPSVADSNDLSNQHRVEYLRAEDGNVATVPRSDLSEGLERRLRVRGSTVSDLSEFSQEIAKLFEDPSRTWSTRVANEERKTREAIAGELLERIQTGRTGLEAGGRGLEEVVKELLEIEGFNASITGKSTYPSGIDADIRATRSDRFTETELLVQVKHHKGTSDTWGGEQLTELRRYIEEDDLTSPRLVLVTSAAASESLRKLCTNQDIDLLEGADLVDWILDVVQDLRGDTRARLGLTTTPQLVTV